MDKYIYPVKVGKNWEFALFEHFKLCPTARYVGGTSNYLCECKDPKNCPGVQAVMREIEHENNLDS
jgi:hypothetical protein